MSLPSFLCIGAQKSATSWLFKQLKTHPSVFLPPKKELHYFDHLYVPENRAWIGNLLKKFAKNTIKRHVNSGEQINLNYIKYLVDLAISNPFTEEWYKRAYTVPDAVNKVSGDVTPEYCMIPSEGIAYLKKLLGDVKIIYMIRNPRERALSQIRMAIDRSKLNPLELDSDSWNRIFSSTPIVNRGDYATYIPRWLLQIPRNDILFIPFGSVKSDPLGVMHQVENHIGVPNFDGYCNPENAVHSTMTKVVVPNEYLAPYESEFEKQDRFLLDYFGTEFVSKI